MMSGIRIVDDDQLSVRSTDSFIVYKPVNVLCSTIDETFLKSSNEEHVKRSTIYDIAEANRFPTDFPLVGRLDYETSGIMLFTKNHDLFVEINTPVIAMWDSFQTEMSREDIRRLYEFKMKHYQVKLLAGSRLVARIKAGETLQADMLEKELSQPFTFSRHNIKHEVQEFHDVRVLRIYQDENLSKGRQELGWCVDIEIVILEGKHHQIRRMATRNNFIVVSLHRYRIAGLLTIDTQLPFPGSCRWLSQQEEFVILEKIKMLRSHLSLATNS
jgi:16S rRNA U516 pseudouridylate synthase RsuA-like enzyme